MFVEIGGIQQWLEIEGNGERPWRDHCCLVHWDQRGAGRTFLKNSAENCQPMTFNQIADDGLEVAAFVCRHLGWERIFVLATAYAVPTFSLRWL